MKNLKVILKKFILLLSVFTWGISFAQTFPYGINYQAVARDANGNAQTNAVVPLRFTVLKTSATGTIIWQETQASNSNAMGQFNAVIGSGVRQPSSTVTNFSDIQWTNDLYFLKVEIQTGITTFVSIGTQQFLSVPYALAAPDPTPAGIIQAYGGITAPVGYLLCQGQAVSRTGVYAKLFAAIGTAYGNGDGSTTFNVPDFRGMFLRGMDAGSGNDPDAATRTAVSGGNAGNNVGSKQNDELKSHNHNAVIAAVTSGYVGTNSANSSSWFNGIAPYTTTSTGGSETRPKNVYVNYIIKY